MQRFGRNFQWKVSSYKWPYIGNGEIEPRLLLTTNKKWHAVYALSDYMKIIDLG